MTYDLTLKYTPEYLREMPLEGLQKLLTQAQQNFFYLRCQSSPHGRVKHVFKPHLFGKVKKDIARIKTIMAEAAAASEGVVT